MQDSQKYRIGRYALAFVGAFLSFQIMNVFTELVTDFAIRPVVTVDAAEAEAASDRFLIFLNSMQAMNTLVAYAVWGFILRRDALVPGIVLYSIQASIAVWILREIMIVADPNATIAGLVLQNWVGWLMSFFACVAGIQLGQYVYQQRFAQPGTETTSLASPY